VWQGNKTAFYASLCGILFWDGGDRRVAELVERYRLNAEKCLQLAQTFNDLEAKRELLVMANAWLVLAAQREKNIETASPGK
jgi:hypothetical protein